MPETPPPDELLAVCVEAARAGADQLAIWRRRFEVREKGPGDQVTDADLASEHAIRELITRRFPDHGFVGEESPAGAAWERRCVWVVDPLDGTANYIRGVPFCAVSIAVVVEGMLAASAVLDIDRGECFAAVRGGPATVNGRPIRCSKALTLEHAMIAVSFPPAVRAESPDFRHFVRLAPRCLGMRRTGSAALNLAYVAAGRFDGHAAHEIHPWDSAAGVLLVEAAGGVATSSRGEPYNVRRGDYLVAATPQLHAQMLGAGG